MTDTDCRPRGHGRPTEKQPPTKSKRLLCITAERMSGRATKTVKGKPIQYPSRRLIVSIDGRKIPMPPVLHRILAILAMRLERKINQGWVQASVLIGGPRLAGKYIYRLRKQLPHGIAITNLRRQEYRLDAPDCLIEIDKELVHSDDCELRLEAERYFGVSL